MQSFLVPLRRRIAKFIAPPDETGPAVIFRSCRNRRVRSRDAGHSASSTEDNVITALLRLVDTYQQATGVSDWEVTKSAGVNNRATIILRRGSPVHPNTSAKLFEYIKKTWPDGVAWPLDEIATTRFGTILTIPAIEKIGGPEAMLRLIEKSGRKRTIGAVYSWAGRSGMPEYARYLARSTFEAQGIDFSEADFSPKRLTPTQITALRAPETRGKR